MILKVTEHHQAGTASFAEVEAQVDDAAFMQRMQPALRKYLTKLREDAFIDIKPGYVDSGASPNQTKPTYSAYTPPAPKKKKTSTARYRQAHTRSTTASSAAATPPTAAAATAGATAATQSTAAAAPKTASSKQVASATMKPGKKEKIRYGQAPRETLPASKGETEHVDAGSVPTAAQEAAAANVPENPLTQPAAPPQVKSRYSDRAKLPKQKKTKGPKPDPFAPPPPTQDETAAQKTQAAPLGLAGDTSKKPKKPKPTEKTRYSDATKPAKPAEATPAATPDSAPPPAKDTTPAPASTPQ